MQLIQLLLHLQQKINRCEQKNWQKLDKNVNFKVVMTFFGKFLEKLLASSTNFQVWSLGLKTQT